jgi:hypothetical protein
MAKNEKRDELVAAAKVKIRMAKALDGLEALKRAMKKRKPAPEYDARVFELEVHDVCEAGADHTTYIEVDLETGDLILAAAEKIISDRAKLLGVPE